MIYPNSQEAPEHHVDVDHTPAHLLDQQPLDGADPMSPKVEHRRVLDTVALDDGLGRGALGIAPQR
jgi:hypothetical protein